MSLKTEKHLAPATIRLFGAKSRKVLILESKKLTNQLKRNIVISAVLRFKWQPSNN
jgi:hypothetical protein